MVCSFETNGRRDLIIQISQEKVLEDVGGDWPIWLGNLCLLIGTYSSLAPILPWRLALSFLITFQGDGFLSKDISGLYKIYISKGQRKNLLGKFSKVNALSKGKPKNYSQEETYLRFSHAERNIKAILVIYHYKYYHS